MKKVFILLFSLIAFNSYGQILIGKRAIARHDYAKLVNDGWDIVLDPIETVPEKTISNKRMSSMIASNWGRDLLLTADLRSRIFNECKYPVVVKVGDTGDPNHDYLRDGHLPPANYTSDSDASDGNGHSTHVIGIIAAKELGLAEVLVSKGLLQFKACKVLSNSGSGSFQWVADMFNKEFSNDSTLLKSGTFVVYNMSLGGGTTKQGAVEAAMKKSTGQGVSIAVANGNTGGAGVQYPGNSEYVIATASLDQSPLQRSSYSTYGPETMVAMPGRAINSTYKGNTFALLSGTSMATPFTTAAIAIARSKWGSKIKSVDHLRAYLAKCATDITPVGRDEFTGYGIEYIKNILDTDPDSIGNVPPPPPPPVNPDSLKRESRVLTIPLRGEWKILYNPTIASEKDQISKKKWKLQTARIIEGEELREYAENLATATLTITALDVAIQTNYYYPLTFTGLKSVTDKFFTNRGLIINGAADLNDGVIWAVYFYDLILFGQYGGYDVEILRVEAKDDKGRTIFIDGSKLKKYTPPKK